MEAIEMCHINLSIFRFILYIDRLKLYYLWYFTQSTISCYPLVLEGDERLYEWLILQSVKFIPTNKMRVQIVNQLNYKDSLICCNSYISLRVLLP